MSRSFGPLASLALVALLACMRPDPAIAAEPATIAIASDAASDADIAERLEQLYATVEGLGAIKVEVDGGVVALTGEVPSREAHDQAMGFAGRLADVVEVQDGLVVSSDLSTRLRATLERLQAQALNVAGMLPLLAVAFVVAALFWWAAMRVAASRLFDRVIRRNPFLRDLARQIVRLVITTAGLVLALQILDASRLLTTLLGAAGVAGLALGFALRDTVENYIASLLLSLRQPFAHDDHVLIDGCEGRVVRLTPRATILITLDGNHTRIPNAKVYKAVIVNYTTNPRRRLEFDVGVSTDQNLAEAQELAARTLLTMKGVLADPPPFCRIETLGDSNVVLKVLGWVDQSQVDFLQTRGEAIRLVKRAFDKADIVMPEPIYNLRMRKAPEPEPGESRPAGADRTHGEEPGEAIDIARKADLDQDIALDRREGAADDLLSTSAPRE